MSQETPRLRVDPIACSGHGVCAELLPELITPDEWGYPVLAGDGTVPVWLMREARRAITDCPALALTLTSPAGRRGSSEEAQMRDRAGAGKLST